MKNIITRIKSAFRRDPDGGIVPLRNKAGGMAWIKTYGREHGADALAGRAVKTVELLPSGLWRIEPMQPYKVAGMAVKSSNGVTRQPGDWVNVSGLADRVLEPWKEDGVSDSEVTELYQPKQERTAV